MPKQKSSATAGTRKKQAKKAGKDQAEQANAAQPQHKKQRGEKKLSKAQKKALPKIKQYIPPPKPPAPPIPDPLDGQGLARTLPAELVVVLRRLGKKDDVTRRKGLEDLREGWITELLQQPSSMTEGGDEALDREMKESTLLSAVPVWLHNLASLLNSPFHRSLALQLHSELLSIPSIRTSILDTLSLGLLPGSQNRDILGSWLVAVLEEGRRAGGIGLKCWTESIYWSEAAGQEGAANAGEMIDLREQLSSIVEFLSLAILDPSSLHDDIHPAPISSTPGNQTPVKLGKGAKAKAPVLLPVAPPVEDESLKEERTARYRVGGLVGLTWLFQQLPKHGHTSPPDDLLLLIQNAAVWSSLSSLSDDESASFGSLQPAVRKAAYSALQALVEAYPSTVQEEQVLQMLSTSLLDCCWLEQEPAVWQTAGPSVVKFLSKYPSAWTIAQKSQTADPLQDEEPSTPMDGSEPDDDSEDNEEADDDDTEEAEPSAVSASRRQSDSGSKSFGAFLDCIATTCPAAPHLTYPLLLVILSSIPESILPLTSEPSNQIQALFSHLWSPVDARLLATHSLPNQLSAMQIFFENTVDCTVYLLGKANRIEGGKPTADWIVSEQLGKRIWQEGVLINGGKAKRRGEASSEVEATIFGKALSRITTIDPDLRNALLEQISAILMDLAFHTQDSENSDTKLSENILSRALAIIAAIKSTNTDSSLVEAHDALITRIAARTATSLQRVNGEESAVSTIYAQLLVSILVEHPQLVNSDTRTQLTGTLRSRGRDLVSILSPSLVIRLFDATFKTISDGTLRQTLWHIIEAPEISQDTRLALVQEVSTMDSSVLLEDGNLDNIAIEAAETALVSQSPLATQVARVALLRTGTALSQDASHTILALVCTAIHDAVDQILFENPDRPIPTTALEIFAAYAKDHGREVITSGIYIQAIVAAHHLVTVVPRLRGTETTVSPIAHDIWSEIRHLPSEEQAMVATSVMTSLREKIGSTSCQVRPSDLIDVALLNPIGDLTAPPPGHLVKSLLPPVHDISGDLKEITARKPDPSLAILDPLIPSSGDTTAPYVPRVDSNGRSSTARNVEAIVTLLRSDRHLAESQPDLLQLVLQASILAQDALAVPGSSRGLFAAVGAEGVAQELIRESEGALSFALASVDEAPLSWHSSTISQLKTVKAVTEADWLQQLLVTLSEDIAVNGGDVSARVFRSLLIRHLRQSGAGEKEAELWLTYSMLIAERLPQLSLAIMLAVKPLLLDSKPLETAQNRLASALTTIPARQANSKGLPALRLLIASAPPSDAASVFLPQQRAMFVLRHIAGWLTSDEGDDLDEEVEFLLAQLYTAFAPIVQDLQGAHWDGIFDLVESGLEGASLEDVTTFPLLHQCLTLLVQIRDLCSTNRSLRAVWTSKDVQLGLVLKLFLQCRDADSEPLQLIQALILELLPDVSEKAIQDASLPALCDLLRLSSSTTIQCSAYRILSSVIRTRTLALVLEVEASVVEAQEGHQARTIALPGELTGIVSAAMSVDWHDAEKLSTSSVLAQLLGWMAILDHFDDASRTLRWAYLDQLNSSGLLTQSLIPLLFAMLGVSEVGAWNFPASQYAVDEFYPDSLELEELPDLAPLASHLFYRTLVTLPSAMRTYYEGLKDRQLSMSMLSFTARHYSPVIIAHEFSALKEPSAMATLTDEGLNVKIAQGGGATVAAGGGSAEAIASYVVDEQPMEIGIRLPAEFPLKAVDVRDLRRVGVPENKWRGWLMSVQQTITSRNGLILEALTVFKKNVVLHFEGVVECAICYSIISLTDRTLPTKPCRTCKNRFHASCLFKWFNSSHSSSCPMCRSLF